MPNSRLDAAVSTFLEAHLQPQHPVLLALSGGPDSLALFHLLLEERERRSFILHAAHVDHGWRPESSQQSEQLSGLMRQHAVPFHCHQLDLQQQIGNAEEWARQERLKFFRQVAQQEGCQAVLMGHHADDQAETVLKRVLEGASPVRVAGMQVVSVFDGLALWRPLLAIHKTDILAWLEIRGIEPFIDETNYDRRYLRARMRQELLPQLTETFGKNVTKGLLAFGRECEELNAYLDARTARYFDRMEKGAFGSWLDLSHEWPDHDVELKHLLRRVCRRAGVALSREARNSACCAIRTGAANHQVTSELYVDRRRLIVIAPALASWSEPLTPLHAGTRLVSPWQVTVEPFEGQESRLGWQAVLQGYVRCVLPQGSIALACACPNQRYRQTSLDRWWAQHQVPAFLRNKAPLILVDGQPYAELLSGRAPGSQGQWCVTLTRNNSGCNVVTGQHNAVKIRQ